MNLDSVVPVIAAVVLAVAATVVLAVFWDRWRVWARTGVAVVVVLGLAGAVGLQLNRMVEVYPPDAPAPPAAAQHHAHDAAATTGSQLLKVTVPGTASHLNLVMWVYLPAAYGTTTARFPVIEALHGYPGSPGTWIRRLGVQSVLDTEIAQGRMAPTVVLFPYQTPKRLLDTECTNLTGGAQTETFVTVDVPAYARAHYRVRDDRAGWALTGYSAGGFCAANLLLRHPGEYAAAASLSGYLSSGIKVGDGSENTQNNVGWRLRHLPQPDVALWLGWAADDKYTRAASTTMAALVHAPMSVTTAVVAHGGHSDAVWQQMEAPAFDWLSAHLARPLAA